MTRTNGLRRACGCLVLASLSGWSCISAPSHAATITINELTDINFGQVPPTAGRLRVREDFCVELEPRGTFNLRGAGDDEGGGFALLNGAGNRIRYDVKVRNRSLEPGVLMTGLRAQPRLRNGNCRPKQRLEVEINQQDLQRAPGGVYRGQLQLIVVPE